MPAKGTKPSFRECRQLDSQVAEATSGRQDAEARCAKYEAGVYGLPEAAAEISDLKQQLCNLDAQRAGKCCMQAECEAHIIIMPLTFTSYHLPLDKVCFDTLRASQHGRSVAWTHGGKVMLNLGICCC